MARLTETASNKAGAIIFNEKALATEYAPNGPPLRERELNQIEGDTIHSLIHHSTPKNYFIIGPQGCGKSASMSYLIRQLTQTTPRVIPVCVDGWAHSTPTGV